MSKGTKPTIRQKTTFDELLKAIQSGQPFSWKAVMVKGGYSPNTAVCPEYNLFSRPGFKTLLESIDDTVLLAKLYDFAVNAGPRDSLSAIHEILTLKDRFPAQKSKVVGLFDVLSNLEDEEGGTVVAKR